MTRDEVRAKLAELPDTADDIAAFLAERGVKGYQRSSQQCPINRYTGAWVTGGMSLLASPNVNARSIPLAGPVIAFIRDFDRGRYPELIA